MLRLNALQTTGRALLLSLLSAISLATATHAQPASEEASAPSTTPLAPAQLWPSLNAVLHVPDWMSLQLALTAEPLAGNSTPNGSSFAWMQQLALTSEFSRGLNRDKSQWQEFDHWKAAVQLTSFSGNPNLNLSLGTAFPLQTTAHPLGLWLTEATLQRASAGDAIFVKAGLMSLNPGFIETDVLNSYINSTLNNTLNLEINGFPINPFIAPAVALHVRTGSGSELRLGQFWLDSVNGLASLFGVNPQQNPSSGSLQMLQWTLRDLPGTTALHQPIHFNQRLIARQLPPPCLQIGGFNVSGPSANVGLYGSLTLAVPIPAGLDHRAWIGFNKGFTIQNNPDPGYLAGGWLAQGLIPGRPLDVLAIGFGSTTFSKILNPGLSPESVIEVNYAIPISSQLTVQPVIQWILQPGGNSARPAAIGGGVQITASF